MDPLPDDVRRFLHSVIRSVDELELLRALSEQPEREWGAAELGSGIQTGPEAAAGLLAYLLARGLVTRTAGADRPSWKYGAATPELAAGLAGLLRLYRERPVTMIKAVYARPADDPLKSFADAFRLRKEGD